MYYFLDLLDSIQGVIMWLLAEYYLWEAVSFN
jgi:hypothetical protein